jgi:hypothetical protein
MTRRARLLPLLLAAAILAPAGAARASWLDPHTRQERIPLAEVERPLIVGKSWLVLGIGFDWKHSTSHFTTDRAFNFGFTEGTHYVRENNDGQWDRRVWTLSARWGFSRNSELYFSLPVVWGSVWNNRMLADDGGRKPIHGVGLGDMHAGVKYQWFRTQSQDGRRGNSFITSLDFRFPTGSESPGSYLSGPNNVATVITGSGVWGFDLEARFKQQVRFFGVEAAVGFTLNPTATVMYLLDDVQNQFNQHLDPGDVVHANVGVLLQPESHIALRGDLFFDYRTVTKWGRTVAAIPACKECVEIPFSDGVWMDAGASFILNADARFGLEIWYRGSLAGRRNFLWPIEELSPSRGHNLGGRLNFRI